LGVITKQEGDEAVQVAQQVPGVKKVIPVFSYVAASKPTPSTAPIENANSAANANTPSADNASSTNDNGVGSDASD
jgi:hypothetical protein